MSTTLKKLDYLSPAAHRKTGDKLKILVALCAGACVVIALLCMAEVFEPKSSQPKSIDRHLSPPQAAKLLAGLQSRLQISATVQTNGGDMCTRYFFDTTETYCRFDMVEDSFDALESELSNAPQKRDSGTWVVEIGLTPDKFGSVTSAPPPWWKGPAGSQTRRIRITAYSEPGHQRGAERWIFYDPSTSVMYVYDR